MAEEANTRLAKVVAVYLLAKQLIVAARDWLTGNAGLAAGQARAAIGGHSRILTSSSSKCLSAIVASCWLVN